MTKKSSQSKTGVNHRVEGSPDKWEVQEPKNVVDRRSKKTLTDSEQVAKLMSETGTISALLEHIAEGKDNDDAQDASPTDDESAHSLSQTQEFAPMTDEQTIKVLIIEDTIELAEVMQATVESMNMQAAWESRGDRALEKLKELQPDVVLLDIALPDMTGWEILEQMKTIATDEFAGVMPKIIVITAYGDPANRLIAKLQNIHSYLIKPITPDQVEKMINKAVEDS